MSAAFNRLQPGAKVQVRLRRDLVAVRPGQPEEVWVQSDSVRVGISPQTDGTLIIARSGNINAAGAGSIASGGDIGSVSTGNSSTAGAPEVDPNYAYTIHAPAGTVIEFLDRDGVTVTEAETVS